MFKGKQDSEKSSDMIPLMEKSSDKSLCVLCVRVVVSYPHFQSTLGTCWEGALAGRWNVHSIAVGEPTPGPWSD